jgi:hypothetical protein
METSEDKPYMDVVPWLIAVFKLVKDPKPNMKLGASDQVYFANESVGIAVGMFLSATQNAGLSTLTHTPSPMQFLGSILRRPKYERPFLLIGVGYPAENCLVPDIERKPLDEIIVVDRPDHPTDD